MVPVKGTTRIVGIFGWPVSHSLSPVMHNAAFAHLGMDYCYVAFPVRPGHLHDAVNGIRALGLRGVNVTIPHKESVMRFLDEISEEAAFIGAANTVVNDNGRLRGFNTDGAGFMLALGEQGISPEGKKVLIVGAGGAARAVGYHLCKARSEVCLYNRTFARAEALASELRKVAPSVAAVDTNVFGDREFFRSVDVIVNATPLGMDPGDPLPVEPAFLDSHHIVCDLIYRETPFQREARGVAAAAFGGLGMLLWQGVVAFEIWTGIAPPVEVMRAALEAQSRPAEV